MPASSLKIGMIGLGVVGTGVAKLLFEQQERLAKKAGRPLELKKVAVRDPSKARDLILPTGKMLLMILLLMSWLNLRAELPGLRKPF